MRKFAGSLAASAALGALLVAATPTTRVIHVPDGGSIQATVDMARRGDMVVVPAGTYAEEVVITTPGIHLTGNESQVFVAGPADPATFRVIDGGGELATGITVLADNVEVSSLRVTGFTQDGIRIEGVSGFTVHHIASYNHGRYGFATIGATNGEIYNTTSSSAGLAGHALTACGPCGINLRLSQGINNAVGLLVENASGIEISETNWSFNGTGAIFANRAEADGPEQGEVTMQYASVNENGNPLTPTTGWTGEWFGHGLVVAGGHKNSFQFMEFLTNAGYGILYASMGDNIPTSNKTKSVTSNTNSTDFAVALGVPNSNCIGQATIVTSDPVGASTGSAGTYDCAAPVGGSDLGLGSPTVTARLAADAAFWPTAAAGRPSWQDGPEPPNGEAARGPVARPLCEALPQVCAS